MLICNKCFKIYEKEYIKCLDYRCTGQIVDIDYDMVSSIILLNNNGYTTKYCCSGHYYEKHPYPYIKFEYRSADQVNLYKKFFMDIPNPWRFEQATKNNFRYPYNNDEFAKKQIFLRCYIKDWESMDILHKARKIKEVNNILFMYLKNKFGG